MKTTNRVSVSAFLKVTAAEHDRLKAIHDRLMDSDDERHHETAEQIGKELRRLLKVHYALNMAEAALDELSLVETPF